MTTRRFDVQLTREAEKDLKRLRPHTERVTRAIFALENDHTLGHVLSGSLKGARSLEFSLPGSGEYRAVYIAEDENQVCLIFIVGPHEDIYDRVERRIKALKRQGRI